MFLRDEAHKSSPTECSPVQVVSPSPVSWVPEVRPSSGKTASEKRSPGTAFRPGWESCSQEVRQVSLLQRKRSLTVPGGAGCQSVWKLTGAILVLAPPLLVPLNSLLQNHSSKASILWRSALFIVQLLHPYMTTGKTIALTRWTFVGKIMSLLFNVLSRLDITFLPRASVF